MNKFKIKTILFLLLLSQAAWAQNFEGTIVYKMTMALSEQQKKEMAQMEQMGYSMPTGFEVSSKNTDAVMKLKNSKGTMMEMITSGDESYVLDRSEKKAYKMPAESAPSSAKPKVTKTEEFETIAGYKCRKYIVEASGGGMAMTQHIWASPQLKMPVPKFSSGLGGLAIIEGVEGIPLKMVMKGGGNSSEIVATSINKSKVNADDLKVPSGYAVEPFNPMIIAKMMGVGR